MKFIAFLRGINVGGKNKINMAELKTCFENLNFRNVVTYINSGNIIFESDQPDASELITVCEQAILNQFKLNITCLVMPAQKFLEALKKAPDWWGAGGESKHNAILVIPPQKAEATVTEIGQVKPEYEKVAFFDSIIFWSAPLKTFSRTRYSKIVGTKLYARLTIRGSSTINKLAGMLG
jgi:uncharacterized protein (DUF1697 family)